MVQTSLHLKRSSGEEQDGARDRRQDGPRRLGHRVGRQKAGHWGQQGWSNRTSFRVEKS